MKTTIFLGISVFLIGVLADDVPNEKVKASFIEALKQIHTSPRIIEAYEKTWDGTLPETLGGLRSILEKVGHSEQEIQQSLGGMATVAKNKDNPSWKTHFGNLFISLGGADKYLVEKFEQNAPDKIPEDINVAKEAFKKVGIPEEHAQGYAKVAVWLGKVHA